MRILHTGDWHLGSKLGRLDLSADLRQQLLTIARYLEDYRVDVMLVAGDLFDDRCYRQPENLQAAIQAMGDAFIPFLAHGGTILAISGNHDRVPILDTFRGVLKLALPAQQRSIRDAGSGDPIGTFHLFTGPHNMKLSDPQGQTVQFQLMPYPSPWKYLKDRQTDYRSPEDRNRLIQQLFTATMRQRFEEYIDPMLPAVLLSHIQIRGVAVQGTHHVAEIGSVLFEPSDVPARWAYAAYGHIHCPQQVGQMLNVRYAGSILRFNAGEALDEKSCVYLEIGPIGLTDGPHLLPLPCSPLAEIAVTDPAEIATLPQRYPQAEQTLAKIILHWHQSWEVDKESARQRVCAIFPRWYDLEIPPVALARPSPVTLDKAAIYQLLPVQEVVRDYARQQFAEDPDRDALLALLEELLTEGV
jgi:exonuclease SbcD